MLLALLAPVILAAEVERTPAQVAFDAAVARMARAAHDLEDAQYLFHQQEYVDGRMQPPSVVWVRYRAPHTLCMRWDAGPAEGRVLVYRPGWNDDKMRVDLGPRLPSLDLEPDGWVARLGQRHTIFSIGFQRPVSLFVDTIQRLKEDWELLAPDVTELGAMEVYGTPSHCLRAKLPKDIAPHLYAREVELCTADATGLPTRIRAWDLADEELQLVESYGYEGMIIDQGFSDEDFGLVPCGR